MPACVFVCWPLQLGTSSDFPIPILFFSSFTVASLWFASISVSLSLSQSNRLPFFGCNYFLIVPCTTTTTVNRGEDLKEKEFDFASTAQLTDLPFGCCCWCLVVPLGPSSRSSSTDQAQTEKCSSSHPHSQSAICSFLFTFNASQVLVLYGHLVVVICFLPLLLLALCKLPFIPALLSFFSFLSAARICLRRRLLQAFFFFRSLFGLHFSLSLFYDVHRRQCLCLCRDCAHHTRVIYPVAKKWRFL